MPNRNTLICTVGTSLIYPNLSNLVREKQTHPVLNDLAQAYSMKNWQETANQLYKIPSSERICGAEINSVADLVNHDEIAKDCLYLLHSDTTDGFNIASILEGYFIADRWRVSIRRVEGLRDDDPNEFRTRGLRNLAKIFGECVRTAGGAEFCAINATGGYKAQIAVAVLMGQALDIPVYYKHERFPAIIPFPPMPVSLDFSLWQRASHMFMALDRPNACEPWERFRHDWDERFEPLVNRVCVDGTEHLELSSTGQIFHEAHYSRFRGKKITDLPPDASKCNKKDPKIGSHSYNQQRQRILDFLNKITSEVPYVLHCSSTGWNKGGTGPTRFRLSSHGIQGVWSEGSGRIEFKVNTTATDDHDLLVIVDDLNKWLEVEGG